MADLGLRVSPAVLRDIRTNGRRIHIHPREAVLKVGDVVELFVNTSNNTRFDCVPVRVTYVLPWEIPPASYAVSKDHIVFGFDLVEEQIVPSVEVAQALARVFARIEAHAAEAEAAAGRLVGTHRKAAQDKAETLRRLAAEILAGTAEAR